MRDVPLKRRTRPARLAVIAAVQPLESRVVLSATATSTTLTASSLAIPQGQRLTLTARIDAAQAGAINQGFVTFTDGSALVGVVGVRDNVAQLDITSLTIGTHRFSAAFGGSGDFLPSQVAIDGSETIRTAAGGRADGYSGDGGPATSAQFYTPTDVAFDRAGNLFIADMGNHAIRRVTPDGIITTVAGTGVAGNSGDGGPATSARLAYPYGVVVGPEGTLYLADTTNQVIRQVTPDGIITRFQGYRPGTIPSEIDLAPFPYPVGLAFDEAGNLYIADTGGEVVRKVTPDGVGSFVAGTGRRGYTGDGGPATAARLAAPTDVAVDAAGNLYIAERVNHTVRRVAPDGTITTVAGTGVPGYSGDGGPASSAQLLAPVGVAVDASGNLFVADRNNVIRRVTPAGIISTVVGNGTPGYAGNDGPAVDARLNQPQGMAFDAAGNLFIADVANFSIREVAATTDVVVTPAPVGFTIAVTAGTVTVGAPYSVVITAVDAAGNPVPQFIGTVRLTTSDANATLSGDVALSEGRGTGLVLFRTAGVASIAATSPVDPNLSGTARGIVVAPGIATRFAVRLDPVVAGLPTLAEVTPLDGFGNVASGYSGTIRLSTPDGLPVAPAPVTLGGGTQEFVVSLGSAGLQSVVATDVANPGLTGTSPAVAVTPMIRGRVFRDSDANGVFGPDEVGLAGRVVFLDRDGNGERSADEPTTVTSADGGFAFPGIAQGSAPVVEAGDQAGSLRNGVSRARTLADGSVEVGVVPFSPLAPVAVSPDPFAGATPSDADDAYVRSLYRAVLGRDGSDAEVGLWLNLIDRGLTRADVAAGFVNSPEHRIRQVGAMYRALLHRGLDPLAQSWADALRAGVSEQDVVAGIVASAEYQSAHPDDDSLVRGLYRDILGRDPDPVGLADRRAELGAGASRAAVVAVLVDSAEAADQAIAGLYSAYFRRTTDPGSAFWSTALRSRAGSVSAIAARLLSSDEFFALASRGDR